MYICTYILNPDATVVILRITIVCVDVSHLYNNYDYILNYDINTIECKKQLYFCNSKKVDMSHSFVFAYFVFYGLLEKMNQFSWVTAKEVFWLLCCLAAGRTIGIPDTWQLWKARLPTFLCHKAVDRAERHQSDNIIWTLWLFVKQSNMTQ